MKIALVLKAPQWANAAKLALCMLGIVCGNSAMATSLYWDTDGTTSGAGGTPTGVWGTNSFWNSDSTGAGGGSFTAATTSADNLFFVAGTNSTGAYTVTLNGNQSANNLTFQSNGAITLGDSSTTINLSGGITAVNTSTAGSARGAVTVNSNIALQANQSFSNANTTNGLTINGVISGNFNLTLSGNGLKTLTAQNTYTGTTTINNSAMTLGGANGSFGTGAVTLGSSAKIQFNHSGDFTLSNNIGGSGATDAIRKQDAFTLFLTGTNTYSGGTRIDNGAISVSSINTNLGGGQLALGNSNTAGKLIYTGSGESTSKTINLTGNAGGGLIEHNGTGALTLSGNISTSVASAKRLTLQGTNTNNNTISGVISNGSAAVGLTKEGAGKWILSGANLYTGTTIVNGGTLLVNGSLASGSAVTVNSTGTLGGTGGVINGTVTANSGSFLGAGDDGTAGTLTLGSTLDISGLTTGTGGLVFDLGTSSDLITLSTGVLTIGTLDFNDFDFTALSGFGVGTYTLFDTTQTISGSLGSTLSGTIGGYNVAISLADSNSDIILTVTAVPEPSTFVMLGAGLGILMVLRRRKTDF